MQFIVFAAFAIVLSVPETGPPWSVAHAPILTWGLVVGQVIAAWLVARLSTRLVKAKLEREPAWLPGAQRRLAQGNAAVRFVLPAGLAASVFLTDWVERVRGWEAIRGLWGVDEFVILLPFFAAILAAWIGLYPADRAVRQVALELRLWASAPARPVWRLGAYLSFMLRQHVLIILAPMIPIVVANDFTHAYRREIYQTVKVAWAHEALLVIIAGGVFLVAPLMLRRIWHTKPLPPGELRDRLEAFCRRVGLTYRRILIWESDGMVVNAAVMGLFKPVRYILLSDGLLEMMDDDKIEAVFGHEAAHVKKRHIQFYLLFAVLSMLIVGGVAELVMWAATDWPGLRLHLQWQQVQDYLQVGAMALIVLLWAFGFGAVSRRFEWQADLFGARSVTPPAERCDQPCFVHGTGPTTAGSPADKSRPVCATAATLFADALQRIAMLNGIPAEARSWRHSSIANRVQLLKGYASDPDGAARLERSVWWIKAGLLAGTAVGLVIALWLYWPS